MFHEGVYITRQGIDLDGATELRAVPPGARHECTGAKDPWREQFTCAFIFPQRQDDVFVVTCIVERRHATI
jgi:hypothetical protein